MEEKEEVVISNVEEDLTDADLDLDDEETKTEEKGKSDQLTETEEETKTETKKKQSREENHYYAELRRKNEELSKKNKELEVKVVEADFNARKKTISKDTLSELDLDNIEDENDLILCEEYEKAVKKGAESPILEAQKAYRNRIKAEKTKIAEEAKQKEESAKVEEENRKKVEADKKAFQEKFGISTKEALADKDFMELYGDLIGYGNMTTLYSKYKSVIGKNDAVASQAKKMGVIPNSSQKAVKVEKSLNDLDGAEFLAAFNKKYN